MPSIPSLVSKLQTDFPELTFLPDQTFKWSPHESTITYIENSNDTASLLHEMGHAVLGHEYYTKDIELIEMERDAWEYARSALSERYHTHIDGDVIQQALDTYREWLHARSTCPHCQATGVQSIKNHYKCVACQGKWRVNDARICALRRYSL